MALAPVFAMVSACGSGDGEEMEEAVPLSSPIHHTTAASECGTTPPDGPGLVRITVETGANGFGQDSKTITWHYEGDLSPGTTEFFISTSREPHSPDGSVLTVTVTDGQIVENDIVVDENIEADFRDDYVTISDGEVQAIFPDSIGAAIGPDFYWWGRQIHWRDKREAINGGGIARMCPS
ncbi:hypothetical protein [Nocardia sp. CNY236]|uniref:hypothetical protein n=1 Tax=Nocardia sp. CNY236 TaxID=1169152 RepID=UPI0012DEB649|nr:hypothetical protein [Nocardia sp. CNY236]